MKKAALGDKNLPHLRQAVDPEAMAPAFEEFFSREYPGRGLKVDECRIDRVYHKPGKNCGIVYYLRCHDQANQPFDPWFYAKISVNGEGYTKPGKAEPGEWPGCGFWKPVSLWREMNMLLHAFPYDPKLAYLGQLLEPDFVKRRVEENLSGFGLPAGWKCREVVCHKIKYMPARRCVLRYEILVTDAANNRRHIVFYSKTYNNARSRYVYEVLQKLCASPACASGHLNIPGPIAHIDVANTLWQQAWKGNKFGDVMQQLGWANLPQSGFVPKIAAMLAALHQIELSDPSLQPGPSPAMVLENAHDDAIDILHFLPEQQGILQRITETLTASTPGPEEQTPQTTIHGSCKVAQILCRDDDLALVDFDSIACGDPLYDVAELIASLVYLRVSDEIPVAPITASVESFLASYQERVPWVCDRRRLAWYVVAFLLGKTHSSLKRLEAKEAENISSAFDLVYEWLDILDTGKNLSQSPLLCD
jgi:hypothetical protein